MVPISCFALGRESETLDETCALSAALSDALFDALSDAQKHPVAI